MRSAILAIVLVLLIVLLLGVGSAWLPPFFRETLLGALGGAVGGVSVTAFVILGRRRGAKAADSGFTTPISPGVPAGAGGSPTGDAPRGRSQVPINPTLPDLLRYEPGEIEGQKIAVIKHSGVPVFRVIDVYKNKGSNIHAVLSPAEVTCDEFRALWELYKSEKSFRETIDAQIKRAEALLTGQAKKP